MSDNEQFDKNKFRESLRDRIHAQINQNIGTGARRPRGSSGIVPGILLITVGTIFLLDHLGFIRAENFWKFWPLILIVVGVVKFIKDDARILGVGIVLVGILLQLHELNYTNLSWGSIWPFLLILIGAQMIWTRFEVPRLRSVEGSPANGGTDSLNEYALFGSVERRVSVSNFRGGSITSIFGGVEVDFRSADIDGEVATVVVETIFGGIELTIPERWNVTFQGQSIFAGYSDETRPAAPDPMNSEGRKTLIVRGRAIFGGIVVKN
jgi:predicted membrane protein